MALLATAALLPACGEPDPAPPSARTLAWRAHVAPFLATHCVDCHGGAEPEGGVSFEAWAERESAPPFEAIREHGETWERMADHVRSRLMPPAEVVGPPDEARQGFVDWVGADIEAAWRAAPIEPGRVTMRRLSRYEYRSTVRDLLGVDFDADANFPADDVGYGFDHIGDVLSLSPILLEKYMTAAERIAEQAVPVVDPEPLVIEAEEQADANHGRAYGGAYVLTSNGEVGASVLVPRGGTYTLRARAWAQQAGPEVARMELRAAGRSVATFDVAVTARDPKVYEREVHLAPGRQRLAAAFVNDYYRPKHPDRSQRDRNLWVDWIELEGPAGAEVGARTGSSRRVIVCEPGADDGVACTQEVARTLLARAFRRPARDEEVRNYVKLANQVRAEGGSFDAGVQAMVQAVLVSPHFLYRVEGTPADGGGVHALDDHALASRLSYFLWSSMPDDALRAEADAGTLRANLHGQVERMLDDPKARALVENFAVQWLELRRLETASPDPKRFAAFDEDLRASMRRETELFVAEIFREDRSILDLLDAPFTWLDQRLAEHYGIAGVKGKAFRRHDLDGGQRGGLLGHASILTLTSYATRTSPTQRGKWLLEEILGAPPPPPPPGVGVLDAQEPALQRRPLRERLQVHREDPSCAVCHLRMDVLGFGLENYDAVGAWRTKDGGAPIDVSGTLPDGRSFARPATLRAILRGDPGFPRCFAEKLLTYAIGRGLEPFDRPAVMRLVDEAREKDHRFRAFVHAVVATDAFTMRRSPGGAP